MKSPEDAASAAKVAGAWGGVAVSHVASTDWQQVAAFCATVYTLYMLVHAMWRHWGRDVAVRAGWLKPLDRDQKIAEAIEEALDK
jgi:hypothetical protein